MLLEHFNDVILILRKNLGEAVSLFDSIVQFPGFLIFIIIKKTGVDYVCSKIQLASDFLGNGQLISGYHFYAQSHFLCGFDSGFRILT